MAEYLTKKTVDLEPFIDEQRFKEKYEFKDPNKEEVLNVIKGKNQAWGLGTGFAMGFFIFMARERKSKMMLLPAAGIMIGSKYYADMKRNEEVKECDLDEYLVKSAGFENHLRYIEVEIKNYD